MQEQIFIDQSKTHLKGNLHTHTTLSDGKYDVSEVLRIYADNHYDFIGITDHDLYCTFNETPGDLIVLAGQEVSCPYIGNPDYRGGYVHFSCFQKSADAALPMPYCNTSQLQQCIDTLTDHYRLVQFNHPLFSSMFANLSDDDFVKLNGYHLLEIYNHKDFRNETGLSSAEILVRRILNAHKKVLLTAGDDFHGPYKKAVNDYFGGGFVMVQAEKDPESILQALEKGEFYPTTGPEILDYRRVGNRFVIKTTPVKNIVFYSNVRRCKNIMMDDNTDVTVGEYEVREEDFYVWAKIVDANGKTAWTQPVYL